MCRTRAQFKHALRFCKNHTEQIKADKCELTLNFNDPKKFWSSVFNITGNKVQSSVNTIAGVSGTSNIS